MNRRTWNIPRGSYQAGPLLLVNTTLADLLLPPARSEAIRRLVELGLKAKK